MTLAASAITMANHALRAPNEALGERHEPIHPHNGEPSAISAAERAVEAAQRIVVERLELMRLEVMEGFGGVLKRAGAVMAAGFVAILGWTGLAIALAVILADYMHPAASIALVGGLHLLIGIALAVWAGASGHGRKAS
jgi:hypothetical protein